MKKKTHSAFVRCECISRTRVVTESHSMLMLKFWSHSLFKRRRIRYYRIYGLYGYDGLMGLDQENSGIFLF